MKKYCFDMSGLSNPFETMPEDIHDSMWKKVKALIAAGAIAVTTEIYEEMEHIGGDLGDVIKSNKKQLILEVRDASWDWNQYVSIAAKMQKDHHDFISEYCGGKAGTVGLKDISIVALAKTLSLPCVSMEAPVRQSVKKRKIPDVCVVEGVQHLTFNEFLRAEQIRL
jgi:hypothetical protein